MSDRTVFACSCEGTMRLDADALAHGCGERLERADQLCGAEIERFRAAAAGGPVTVGCTLQAPLFTELAEELGAEARVRFANLREHAGWSTEGEAAGPKMAGLLAAAEEPAPQPALVSMESTGVALVYGTDEAAIAAGRRLADHLDVTVLLTQPRDVAPPLDARFPVVQGTVRGATGHLGQFALQIDGYALPAPSSRDRLVFGPGRDGAASTCDMVIDLSGGVPLFPAHEVRSGYLRADPRDPAAVERVLFEASHLVGTFDKLRYVDFHAELCAHSRSRITGCTRCLDVCPTGAIAPAGDTVAIDPYVCAGCGNCAAVCPTGAAAYAVPPADALMRTLRRMLLAYHEAGGRGAVVLFHDADHGEPLIHALARHGAGLPANVLPVAVNEATQIGPEALAALLAYGAAGARVLTRARPRHDLASLARTLEISEAVGQGLGYGTADGAPLFAVIETDDPDALGLALAGLGRDASARTPARFLPDGGKRDVLRFAFRELHVAAPAPVAVVALPAGAPFGGLAYDAEACTLCHACVGACPTHALGDSPDRPLLAFEESLCVQCGLCVNTCPEDAITALAPRLDFAAWAEPRRILKEEEPFACVACAKPFGTRSTVERIVEKLRDRHWMFAGAAGEARIRSLMMCEDCRVEAAVNEGFDPHGAPGSMPARALTRTTEDYLRERGEG